MIISRMSCCAFNRLAFARSSTMERPAVSSRDGHPAHPGLSRTQEHPAHCALHQIVSQPIRWIMVKSPSGSGAMIRPESPNLAWGFKGRGNERPLAGLFPSPGSSPSCLCRFAGALFGHSCATSARTAAGVPLLACAQSSDGYKYSRRTTGTSSAKSRLNVSVLPSPPVRRRGFLVDCGDDSKPRHPAAEATEP
jgi:hypothetical protein